MNQQEKDFDVMIVGGGAVGGAMALALAKQGYQVGILELNDKPIIRTDPERVVALSYGSKCFLDTLGVWDDDIQSGLIRHIEVREGHNHGLVQMHAEDVDIEALGYVVEIADVVRPIEQALEGQVRMFRGARLQAMQTHAQGVDIQVSHQGQCLNLTASLLIGADGTNSQVRRMANIGTHGWDHNRFALVASLECEKSHDDTAYECFRNSGPLAFLPLADGRFSIVWALAPQEAMRLLEMPDRMFLKRLQRAADESVLPRSGYFKALSKRACFPLELRIAKEYARHRMALIGNAAHTIHPVAGQGMNLGLRDVEVLAHVLNQTAAHQDAGKEIMLQAYTEQRRLDVLAVAGFTESMLAGFSSNMELMRLLRAQGLGMMQTLAPLRQPLLQHAAGLAQMNKNSNDKLSTVGDHS